MKLLTGILITAILFSSCHGSKSENQSMELYDIPADMPPITRQYNEVMDADENDFQRDEATSYKKKIINDGRIAIEVKNLDRSKVFVDSLVNKYEGYYETEKLINTDYQIYYILKIRIPSKHYKSFIPSIELGEGVIMSKEIEARDVTTEFIDLESRLDNKRNYLKKYIELLKQAKNVKEIVEIEEIIRNIEEEIDSSDKRLKYLNNRVNYSTLELEITEIKTPATTQNIFIERIGYAFSNG